VHAVLYGVFFMYLCKQSSRREDVLDIICCNTYSSAGNILYLIVV